MNDKKYLDKVTELLVRGTKIDYGIGRIYTPFSPPLNVIFPLTTDIFYFLYFSTRPSLPFTKYCVNHFGLTEEEIRYVWEKYKDIILEKLKDGE